MRNGIGQSLLVGKCYLHLPIGRRNLEFLLSKTCQKNSGKYQRKEDFFHREKLSVKLEYPWPKVIKQAWFSKFTYPPTQVKTLAFRIESKRKSLIFFQEIGYFLFSKNFKCSQKKSALFFS